METTLGIPTAATGARFDEADGIGFHATGIQLADGLAASDSEDEEEDDDEDDEEEDAEDEGEGEEEGQ
jgi:hypothetical protein